MREAGYHRIIITLFVTPVKVKPLLGWILLICNPLPNFAIIPAARYSFVSCPQSQRTLGGTPWRAGNAERTSFFYFCCAYLPGNLRRDDAVAHRKPRPPLRESLFETRLYLFLSDPESTLPRLGDSLSLTCSLFHV